MNKDLFVSALLDVYGEFLNDKQRQIASYYYDDDLSLSEIAENEGITRQGVRDFIKRAEQQLYRLEERCGYCRKFLRLKELGTEIKNGEASHLPELLDIIEEL